MYDRHWQGGTELAGPIEEQGLLEVLDPSHRVDEELTQELAELVVELLVDGFIDDLPQDVRFLELSMSLIGYGPM